MTEETPATSTDAALGSEGDADQLPREDMLLERGVELAIVKPEVWEMPEGPSGDREEYRAGRLEADDDAVEAGVTDTFAHDVGVAGGAASAEEAAVHVIPDPDQEEPLYRADDEHE